MVIFRQETATIVAITAEKQKHGLEWPQRSREAMVESDVIRERQLGMQGLEGRSKLANRVQRDPHKLRSDGRGDG
jgi:hypothetical protein